MGLKNKRILSLITGVTVLYATLMLPDVYQEKSSLTIEKSETKNALENQNDLSKSDVVKNEEVKDIQSEEIKNTQSNEIENTLNEKEVNMLDENKNEDEVGIDYRSVIQIDGQVSENLITLLNQELNKVPSNVIEKFLAIGGKIILTSYDIATTYYNDYSIGSLMELHDGRKQILYVSAREKAIREGAIHGMGHVLDSITGWNSFKNNEFLNIYHEEQHTLQTEGGGTYHKTNEREFFAEVFYQYLLNPDRTTKSAPQAVKFINNLVNTL